MFLHAGAGLHGHEYSPKHSSDYNARVQDIDPSSENTVSSDRDEEPPVRPTSQLLPGLSYVSALLPSPKSFWERPSSDYFIKKEGLEYLYVCIGVWVVLLSWV